MQGKNIEAAFYQDDNALAKESDGVKKAITKYIVQLKKSAQPCWLASIGGDPGRNDT